MAIVQKDAPVLREKAHEVPLSDINTPKINDIIRQMKESLAAEYDGVAIAAPQVGVSLRIFVVSGRLFAEDEKTPAEDIVFINPVIKKASRKKEDMEEGCLSVRWKYGTVKRSVKATVVAYDERGDHFTYNASGLLAQIFQHETDHLDGILFIDKAQNVRDIDPAELKDMHQP